VAAAGASGTAGGAGGGGGLAGALLAGQGSCEQVLCQGHLYACGDCNDNDADSLTDSADPDCLGPCDNTEDSYYGAIPGQSSAPCKQDCHFDQDTGSGNDDCYWSHECDPLARPPDYPPSGDDDCEYDSEASVPGSDQSCADLQDEQSDTCLAVCLPLTPNGCDCFGCCELPAGSDSWVWIGSTANGAGSCERESVDDPSMCRPCTPVQGCLNPCERCEICVGKPTLPSDCEAGGEGGAGGANTQCPPDIQTCGQPGQPLCLSHEYCISGCCIPIPQ